MKHLMTFLSLSSENLAWGRVSLFLPFSTHFCHTLDCCLMLSSPSCWGSHSLYPYSYFVFNFWPLCRLKSPFYNILNTAIYKTAIWFITFTSRSGHSLSFLIKTHSYHAQDGRPMCYSSVISTCRSCTFVARRTYVSRVSPFKTLFSYWCMIIWSTRIRHAHLTYYNVIHTPSRHLT